MPPNAVNLWEIEQTWPLRGPYYLKGFSDKITSALRTDHGGSGLWGQSQMEVRITSKFALSLAPAPSWHL